MLIREDGDLVNLFVSQDLFDGSSHVLLMFWIKL